MDDASELLTKLEDCPKGRAGWSQFEKICTDLLCNLFVPPLKMPKIQPRTLSGTDRRDAVFPNRTVGQDNNWAYLLTELNARMILVEFKNYDSEEIDKTDVNQVAGYLTEPMGQLAILCGTKSPSASAKIKRNTIYSQTKKVILFLTTEDLKEMVYIRERGEDPSDLIVDSLEWFYLQHE